MLDALSRVPRRLSKTARRLRKRRARLRKRLRPLAPGEVSRRLESRSPLYSRVQRHRRVREAKVVFVSYPKSGRTWLRYFLDEYLARTSARPHGPAIAAAAESVSFTHGFTDRYPDRWWQSFRSVLGRRRMILLVRDPRDVAVSRYHQKRHRQGVLDCELPEFLDSPFWGIERQSAFVLDLLDVAGTHPEVLLLSYEGLKASTERELRRFLEFALDQPVDEEALREAMEESSFDAMRRREVELSAASNGDAEPPPRPAHATGLGVRDWDGKAERLKTRRGKVGGFRLEMDDALQADVAARPKTAELLARLAALNADAESAATGDLAEAGAGAEARS